MRIIHVTVADRIEAFDGPTEVITPELMTQIMAPVRENQLRIIETSAIIEHTLEAIISHYFFGTAADTTQGKTRFQSLILSSDWCTFSVKRRLVMHIVNETNALEGKAKNDFDATLRKIISYRNAFVHGVFSSDGRRVKLSYFESSPKFKYLDDDYLQIVEQKLNTCFTDVHKIAHSVGALKLSELSGPPDLDDSVDPRNWDRD
jgi:hypothetical protein